MDTLDSIIQTISTIVEKSLEIIRFFYNYQGYLIAAIIILLAFYIIIRVKKHLSPIKLFDNNNGIVSLKKKALFELVESVCYDMGSLNKPKIKLHVKRKRLSLDVSLKIESNQRLVDFTSKLQDRIQMAFIEQLGIEKVGKINVNISEFKGLLKKPLSLYQKRAETNNKGENPIPTEEEIDSEI